MMILNVRWCWDWAFRPLSRRVAAAPRVQRPPRGGSGQFFPGPPLRPRAGVPGRPAQTRWSSSEKSAWNSLGNSVRNSPS